MEQLDTKTILFLMQSLLCLYFLVRHIQIKKNNIRLNKLILQNGLALAKSKKEAKELQVKCTTLKKFQNSLAEAELTTKLQQPRLQAAINSSGSNSPERYQYISSLVQKGMDAKEISSVLGISPHETEQLLNLSRIAKGN